MPSKTLRQKLVGQVKLVVIKVGSDVLAKSDSPVARHDRRVIRELAQSIAKLHQRGVKVVLVSSGAIGRGLAQLERASRPKKIEQLQAAAAIGQPHLMRLYEAALAKHGLKVGQILLTRSDFEDRTRYLNTRRTVDALHKMRAVPIINENDSVAVEEIRFGENDILAALVGNLLRANLLIFLSSVDGLLKDGRVVAVVEKVDEEIYRLDQGRRSRSGVGGMRSKLQAAALVTDAGDAAIIANGKLPHIVDRLLQGEELGTLFIPAGKRVNAHKRWIGTAAKTAGTLSVDSGAAQAILKSRKSLLAIGITSVQGSFRASQVVEVLGPHGQ
ncbi:MAG: glutamate 5-kinase, partial [Phycisphaerae bacterium]|nr:glutamate 5-kinase [Phycisphaerae bacterium]